MRIFIIMLFFAYCLPTLGQPKSSAAITEVKNELAKSSGATNNANLLCKLALVYVYKPGEMANDLDSALLLVKQAEFINSSLKDRELQAKIYFIKSNALREKGNTDMGHNAIDRSIELYERLPATVENGEAYVELSYYYDAYTKDGCIKRIDCLEKALTRFRTAGIKEKQADALKNLADLNQMIRNYGLATIYLQESLAIYMSIGHKELQGVYDLLGHVSTNMGDFTSAIKYGLLAIQTAENVNDTTMQLCTIYHRLATVYGNCSLWQEADTYEEKAIAVAMKYRDKDAIETTLLGLAHFPRNATNWQNVLKQVNNAAMYTKPWNMQDTVVMSAIYQRIYSYAKDFKNEERYANILIRNIPNIINNASLVHAVYPCLANHYFRLKNYKLAKKYIDAELEYSIQHGNKRSIAVDYHLSSIADSGMHQFKEALKNYQLFKMMSDSMLNERNSFQLAQMRVVYETEKKDKDLKIKAQNLEVTINKTKVQEISLKKAELVRNIIIMTGLVFISILITGYKIKQRHNSKLASQQREISTQNQLLKESLNEQQKLVADKDWLVKEIHHRVKNNLQMIISLLNAQSEFLEHPSALNAVRESRERMQAIALIHQKLYNTDQGTLINMESYIRELVNFLYSGFADAQRVQFNLDVAPIQLDVSQSVPLGLILNEAITNVFKYAFKKDQKGKVAIELSQVNETDIMFKIADNGQGFSKDFDLAESNSLGIQLIKLFAEQLEGDLHITSGKGVEISLIFKQQYSANRASSFKNFQPNGRGDMRTQTHAQV